MRLYTFHLLRNLPPPLDSRRDRYTIGAIVFGRQIPKKKIALSHGLTADRFSPPVIRSDGRPSGRLASQPGGSSNHFCVSGTLVRKRQFSRLVLAGFHRNVLCTNRDVVIHVFARFTRAFTSTCRSDDFADESAVRYRHNSSATRPTRNRSTDGTKSYVRLNGRKNLNGTISIRIFAQHKLAFTFVRDRNVCARTFKKKTRFEYYIVFKDRIKEMSYGDKKYDSSSFSDTRQQRVTRTVFSCRRHTPDGPETVRAVFRSGRRKQIETHKHVICDRQRRTVVAFIGTNSG